MRPLDGMNTMPARSARPQKGSGSRNMARQDSVSMAMPPTAGPSAGASTIPAPYTPIAMPRRSGGNTVKIVTIVIGMTMPAAMPCRTRPRMSMSIEVAVALIRAPAMKTASVSAKPSLCPNASVIQALSSWLAVIVARKAVAIHCAWS